ncbi:MAG: TetR/AcrR family transcriptional regulator [Gemmatimonadota bacterium]|nr:TetR/AcrR family transcriptional regulator [Gemmatimonadota bacterium]
MPASQPTTTRGRRSRDRILAAVEALLTERAFGEITVTDIAERAGVSAGLLYSHFDAKDEILPYLILRFYRRVHAQLDERLPIDEARELAVGERLSRLVDFLVEVTEEHAGLVRAAAARRLLSPSEPGPEERSANQAIRDHALAWLAADEDATEATDPGERIGFAHVSSLLLAQLIPLVERDPARRRALLAHMKRATTAYLSGSESP